MRGHFRASRTLISWRGLRTLVPGNRLFANGVSDLRFLYPAPAKSSGEGTVAGAYFRGKKVAAGLTENLDKDSMVF
jgi:hypothetical protein